MRQLLTLKGMLFSIMYFTTLTGFSQKNFNEFPNTVGDYWEYNVTNYIDHTQGTIRVEVISKKRMASGDTVSVWRYSWPAGADTQTVAVAHNSIRFHDLKGRLTNVYQFPLTAGGPPENIFDVSAFTLQSKEYAPVTFNHFKKTVTENAFHITKVFHVQSYGMKQDDIVTEEYFVPRVGMIRQMQKHIYGADTIDIALWELTDYSIHSSN